MNKIHLIDVKTDNITDYKNTSLQLIFPYCSGKCEGCQNYKLHESKVTKYRIKDIVHLYNKLSEHKAVVCAGLEPFDSFEELKNLLIAFAKNDKKIDFVIYTGYELEEIEDNKVEELLKILKTYSTNDIKLIIKYGRYDKDSHNKWLSSILGVELINNSSQQYVYEYTYHNNMFIINFEREWRQ